MSSEAVARAARERSEHERDTGRFAATMIIHLRALLEAAKEAV